MLYSYQAKASEGYVNNRFDSTKGSSVRNNFYRMLITGMSGVGNSGITPNIMRDNRSSSSSSMSVEEN